MGISANTRASLTIDLAALGKNYRTLTNELSSAELAAVVKANAYGLGIKEVATALSNLGCINFFVATIDEGIELRQILPNVKIYIFHGVLPGTADELVNNSLIPVLNSLEQIENWLPYAEYAAALHIDTGMSRLGLTPQECAQIQYLPSYNIDLIMSHLSCAEDKNHPKNREQVSLFEKLRKSIPSNYASLAASSGIFLGPNFHFDLCRAGVSLYGINPTPLFQNPFAQVVRLRAKILQIRSVDTPQTVGYGATHRVRKPTKIATLAIGYADGYMRSLGNSGVAFIEDYKVPVVGHVSMDLTTVDVTNVPDTLFSSKTTVDLIGPNNPIDQIARQAGTISYELLTGLGDRVERHYHYGEG
nr:alanine racemase [Rhodospirillales bacterium]